MKEIISLHIGQAGVQLGSGVWELFIGEHGVDVNGNCTSIDDEMDIKSLNRLFFQTPDKKVVPRAIFVDFEPTVIDDIKKGIYKDLFGSDYLISGFEDAASLFSRGYFSLGRFFINKIMDNINKQIEYCDNLQAFCFTHSSGGGTGSGLFSLILEEMEEFTKIMKMDLCIHPSFPISPIIVEPYNSVLTSHYTIDITDISFLTDNESLYNLASKHLDQNQTNYHLINRITSQLLSSITATTRFDGQSTTISEYLLNLVPYPRIHFPVCSMSPILSPSRQLHNPNTIYSLTKDAMSQDFQMIKCFPMEGKFMSCCLMYRGDISPGDVYNTIERLKCYNHMQFVDWSPTGIKITICNKPSTVIVKSGISFSSRNLTMISNNSAIIDALLQNTFRFHILFKKRVFVHWFIGEGMEEEEFKDSLENIACLVKDYEECAYPTKLMQKDQGENEIDDKMKNYSPIQKIPSEHNDNQTRALNQENNDNISLSHSQPNTKAIEDFISEDISQISSLATPVVRKYEKLRKIPQSKCSPEKECETRYSTKYPIVDPLSKSHTQDLKQHHSHSLQESHYLVL